MSIHNQFVIRLPYFKNIIKCFPIHPGTPQNQPDPTETSVTVIKTDFYYSIRSYPPPKKYDSINQSINLTIRSQNFDIDFFRQTADHPINGKPLSAGAPWPPHPSDEWIQLLLIPTALWFETEIFQE